jgi:hypothetical protein
MLEVLISYLINTLFQLAQADIDVERETYHKSRYVKWHNDIITSDMNETWSQTLGRQKPARKKPGR